MDIYFLLSIIFYSFGKFVETQSKRLAALGFGPKGLETPTRCHGQFFLTFKFFKLCGQNILVKI